MSIPNQEKNWQEKGFGWIPDLPDITDPGLPTALNNEMRILTQEGTSHLEEVAGDVIDLLEKSGLIEKKKIDKIKQKLLGETFFPPIKIHKTLRKGFTSSPKRILQLKQAFYSIYLTAEKDFKKKLKKAYISPGSKDTAGESMKLIQWLQEPVFDDQLEKLVKTFQRRTGLLVDGIVGLRTYTKLRLFISGEKSKNVKVNLLCPSTLIPNEILEEVFNHLVDLWIFGKFRAAIQDAFQNFSRSSRLNHPQFIQSEAIYAAQLELEEFTKEELIKIRRDEIASFRRQKEKSNFFELLASLKNELIQKCKIFDAVHGLENLDNSAAKQGNNKILSTNSLSHSMKQEVEKLLEDKTLFLDSFIVNSTQAFVVQFESWFYIIEPLVSAFLQLLSPLANFDNLKQAIDTGFARLESCFQLYHLENRPRFTAYKILLSSYSPAYLSDQIEEISELRESVAELLWEAFLKIDRKQKEADEEDEKRKEAREEVNKDILSFSFFEFLKDILAYQYGISEDDLSCQSRKETDLQSLLTAKRELFEIDNSFLEKKEKSINLSLQNVDCSSQVNEVLFLEPVTLQLPINARLLKKLPSNDTRDSLIFWWKWFCKIQSDRPLKAKAIDLRFIILAYHLIFGRTEEISYFFLPGNVDLSYWCPPIKDQDNLNACTAFAGITLMEYFAQRRYGKYINLSPRFLYKVSRNLMNRADDLGASVRQTMKALALFGVPPEEVWPWRANEFNEEPPAFCYAYAQSFQSLKYFRLDAANPALQNGQMDSRELLLFQIKAVLAAGLPCIFGFTVYSSFFKDKNIRRGYVAYPSAREQVVGGHAAVAVGYNDYKVIDRVDGEPAKRGAFLIRNSWGTAWGDGGYGWLPYEYVLGGLTADWWSLLKSEWFDGGAFGLGAVDPGTRPDITEIKNPPVRR